MRYTSIFVAALPVAWAANLAYRPPHFLAKQVLAAEDDNCVFPANYHVKGMTLASNDTGKTLSSCEFTFNDFQTHVSTLCQFNQSSVGKSPTPGATKRYSCTNPNIQFIYEPAERELTVVEQLCPDSAGVEQWEVAGTLNLNYHCSSKGGKCHTNSTTYQVTYTSLNPTKVPGHGH